MSTFTTDKEPNVRNDIFAFRVSEPEHGLLHQAARFSGASTASEWARGVLLAAARKRFRSALREAGVPSEEAEPVEVRA